jgi:hyperosmotically inducible periplasmic protein
MQPIIKLIAALALVGSVAACDAISGKETAGQYVDDTTITTRVKAAFAEDPVVKAREVSVETLKSEVQLGGFVRTRDEATRAAQIAQNVRGVRAVHNNIQVRP